MDGGFLLSDDLQEPIQHTADPVQDDCYRDYAERSDRELADVLSRGSGV